MNKIKYIISVIIGVCIGYCFAGFFKEQKTIFKTQTVKHYLPQQDTVFIPKIIYKDTGTHSIEIKDSIIRVPIFADTSKIIADYLKQKNYSFDTTLNEINARINASVYANKLIYMDYHLQNLRNKEAINKIFLGADFGVNKFSTGVFLQRNKFLFSLKYDFMGAYNGFRFGVAYRLK